MLSIAHLHSHSGIEGLDGKYLSRADRLEVNYNVTAQQKCQQRSLERMQPGFRVWMRVKSHFCNPRSLELVGTMRRHV